jgi:TrmH family RNA methyltransferase
MTNLSEFPHDGMKRWVAMYEVRDPGNLGTVIRTADAAGCDGVMLIGQTCDPFSVEAVRATMGSLFAMPLASVDFETFDEWRKKVGARMVAASMRGIRAHDAARYGERSVVLMGNEQSGLPVEVEGRCDELVRIPMMGAADSLNLASAAAVMIYEVWRTRGYAGARK